MLHGVDKKDADQREFQALLNTEAMGKVWQEESLAKEHPCFKHSFHRCTLAYVGRASCQMLCVHPGTYRHMHVWKNGEEFLRKRGSEE